MGCTLKCEGTSTWKGALTKDKNKYHIVQHTLMGFYFAILCVSAK